MTDIHSFRFYLPCSVEKYFDVSNVRLKMYARVCVCVCVCVYVCVFYQIKKFSNEISFTNRRRTSE